MVVNIEDVVLVGAVSVAHAWHLGGNAKTVVKFRKKHKIKPPDTTGPPDFIRALRAQQNGLEFGVPFQIVLWTAGLFAHQVPAAAIGSLYIISRVYYNKGYIEDADKRMKPFWYGIYCLQGLFGLALCGIANTALKHFADVDLFGMLKQKLF